MIAMRTTNFSATALLGNLPILEQYNGSYFVFNMPTIAMEHSSIFDYSFFLSCCAKPIEELRSELNGLTFNSKYDLMKAICKSGSEIGTSVLCCLGAMIQDFKYVTDSFYCGNAVFTDEVFEIFCDYVSIAAGLMTFEQLSKKAEEQKMSEEERAWERKKRLHASKIQRTKQKNGKGVDLETVMACVCYEFNIPLKDIVQMNKYSVFFLYNKVGKISNYEVTKIAAGTGNLGKKNKHKYWTD